MSVFRIERTSDYTVMSNHHLRNTELSLTAKGLLSQMLSLPENWDYTLEGLAKINKEGVSAVRTAVKELETAGYVQRRRLKDASGKFGGNEYIIREYPVSVSPSCDFPTLEDPSLENRTQLNIDILNTNTPLSPPEGDKVVKKKNRKRNAYKSQAEILPERFEKFWSFYRAHVPPDRNAGNRQQAIRAWDKLSPSDELATAMAIALAKQVKSKSWASGVGVPHASTWLNNHGWEDDWGQSVDEPSGSVDPPDGKERAEWVS